MPLEKKYICRFAMANSETVPKNNELKTAKFLSRKVVTKKDVNRGAWTADEDEKLAQVIAIRGAKKWKTIAAEAGINRCGKSCRLRWMNYLRPNIKRGNISDQEEDLIVRLHKLLGNRWSLIAGRLPGRTDNEIKNYWNSHLSKKISKAGASPANKEEELKPQEKPVIMVEDKVTVEGEESIIGFGGGDNEGSNISFNVDEFFDFSNEGPLISEWMNSFVEQYQLDHRIS